MIAKVTDLLASCAPFVLVVAMIYGVVGEWLGLADIFPVIKQLWSPKGTAQGHAIVGACLALISWRMGGGSV